MAANSDRALWAMFGIAADAVVRARVVVCVLLAITGGSLVALTPVALKSVVDQLVTGSGESAVLIPLGIYVAVLAGSRLMSLAQVYLFETADQRMQRRLSVVAFQRLLRAPLSFYVGQRTGETVQAHAQMLQGVRQLLLLAGFTLLPAIAQMLVMIVVVATLFNPTLWLVLAISLAVYACIFSWGIRRIIPPTESAVFAQGEATGLFVDALGNIETVKTCSAENAIGDRYRSLAETSETRWRRCAATRLETGLSVALIFVLNIGGLLALGVLGPQQSASTVGDFVLLNAYVLQIVGPVEMTGFALRDLAQAVSHLRNWRELLRRAPDEGAQNGYGALESSHVAGSGAATIRFEHICLAYTPERAALSDIDFHIPAGSVTAVVGPSGAGKSSLLRLLQRHYEPTSGKILIDERPIADLTVHALRCQLAVVPQEVMLLNDTLRYNLLFANPGASPEDLARALRLARLEDMVARLPEGLDTPVGERGLKLSGGERQRIALARAVLRQSPILILDEATAALDTATEAAVSRDLIAAAAGRTTLIITHRLALAALADMIVVLDCGRIAERGHHDDLLAANGVYALLWRQQLLMDTNVGRLGSEDGAASPEHAPPSARDTTRNDAPSPLARQNPVGKSHHEH